MRPALLQLAASVALAACAPLPLRSTQTDDKLHAVLDTNFPPGMSLTQVDQRLTDLHAPTALRLTYPATDDRPLVRLVRLLPPGGAWPDTYAGLVEFVDVSFVFQGDPPTLTRWAAFRDGIHYEGGEPLNAPRRPLMGRVPRWPGSLPPPVDPLQGTR